MLIITLVVASGFALVLCHVVGLPIVSWVIPLLGALVVTGFYGAKLFKPDDTMLGFEMDSRNTATYHVDSDEVPRSTALSLNMPRPAATQ